MKHPLSGPAAARRLFAALAVVLVLAACASSTGAPATSTPEPSPIPAVQPPPLTPTPIPPDDAFSDLPDEARAARGGGQPRTAGYWALWNTCAPENRAEVAAANGGRQAGWILVDDLLADPGIQLGNYLVPACQEALALLQGRTADGEESGDPIYGLAAVLLAAELNMRAGGETCPIAEEAAVGGHMVLDSAGFDGSGAYAAALSDEMAQAIPRLVELLAGYNRGELCR
ncbi:MAG: hypothetical protein P8129_16820 [Anaerolineae bacterium]